MDITLIGGAVIPSDDIVFNYDALNNGTSPVFEQSSTGIVLDNLLKVADMDTLFTPEGWTYDKWNAWRAAHPYSPTAYTPFQNQDNIPGTSTVGNLFQQNWLSTAGNYYLDALDTPAKKIGAAVVAGLLIWGVVSLARD